MRGELSRAELDRRALFGWRDDHSCAPGVLTEFGHTLREQCGRVHWAGTESPTVMCGWIDGAVRSGERAAAEVMSADTIVAV